MCVPVSPNKLGATFMSSPSMAQVRTQLGNHQLELNTDEHGKKPGLAD